jgi:hypothetical protein
MGADVYHEIYVNKDQVDALYKEVESKIKPLGFKYEIRKLIDGKLK